MENTEHQIIDLITQDTSQRDALVWFLRTQKSPNTRRAYMQAIRGYEEINGGIENGISKEKISEWVARMGEKGLADATINQRLAAVSSYLVFIDNFGLDDQAKSIQKFVQRMTRKVNPYEKSTYLSSAQLRSLMEVIDRSKIQGARDYALFLMFIATGRRSAEIRTLQWSNFMVEQDVCWYSWVGKGKKLGRGECPWDVWTAINRWLEMSGRLENISGDDYIFTALNDCANRLPTVQDWKPGEHPLSMQAVSQLLRKYARKAGIGGRIHIHMLRHSAAMLRSEAGEDLYEIQKFLGHNDLSSTLIYMHRVKRSRDESWAKIRDMLGIRWSG